MNQKVVAIAISPDGGTVVIFKASKNTASLITIKGKKKIQLADFKKEDLKEEPEKFILRDIRKYRDGGWKIFIP
jgi:hypothetical protein